MKQRARKHDVNLVIELLDNFTIIEKDIIGTQIPDNKCCLQAAFVSKEPVAKINEDLFKITPEELIASDALIG
jgi:hypothetical protein